MHPLLEHLDSFTLPKLLSNDNDCKTIFEVYNIIPTSETQVNCPSCAKVISVAKDRKKLLGFVWRCRGLNGCGKTLSPATGTIFSKVKLSFADLFCLIYQFLEKKNTCQGLKEMNDYRKHTHRNKCSSETYVAYKKSLRSVCETIAINDFYTTIGGPGLKLEIDETFLTKRKYHRGRVTESMTVTIFGILCREQRRSIYFRVPGKAKHYLWPIVAKYAHQDSSNIYSDSALQYVGIEHLFANAIHKKTNHSAGQYVDENDKDNHINSLECDNRWMKKHVVCRNDLELIDSQIQTFVYFRNAFPNFSELSIAQKIERFLIDISRVFPGVNGIPLQWFPVEIPTPELAGIADLV